MKFLRSKAIEFYGFMHAFFGFDLPEHFYTGKDLEDFKRGYNVDN